MPAFLVVHPFINLRLVINHIFFWGGGGQRGAGLTLKLTYGKNLTTSILIEFPPAALSVVR